MGKGNEKRVFQTIDKHFDGEEGYLAWYCQEINGKIYPLQGTLLVNWGLAWGREIFQIEYHYPFLFILLKRRNETLGNLQIVDVRTPERDAIIYNLYKFFVFESTAGKVLGIFHEVGGQNRISSITFDMLDSQLDNITLTRWFQSEATTIPIADVMVYDGRVFVISTQENKVLAYFSQFLLNPYPELFFENPNLQQTFFTFPEYFILLPSTKKFLAYAGYLITEQGVFRFKPLRIEGAIQYVPEKILDFPVNPSKIEIQIPTPNEVYISQESQTIEVISGKMYSDFYVYSYLSNSAEVSIRNELHGSILFKNETKRRIDFALDEQVIVLGDVFVRRYIKNNENLMQVFYLSSSGNAYYDGKLYFISHFQDYMHTKYIKRVKIRRFQDVWNLEQNLTKLDTPQFPFTVEKITDETHFFEEEWNQTRGAGKVFLFEFEPFGILPVLDVEYDMGK